MKNQAENHRRCMVALESARSAPGYHFLYGRYRQRSVAQVTASNIKARHRGIWAYTEGRRVFVYSMVSL